MRQPDASEAGRSAVDVTAELASFATNAGYPALIALVAAESAGVPLPGETALIAGSLLAAHGNLSITTVIAFAACAAIAGDNLGYQFGRRFGRRALERPGRLAALRTQTLATSELFFDRHGATAVVLGRWMTRRANRAQSTIASVLPTIQSVSG
jgi:membrane protein DedA with SNARE-associated domain